MKKTEFNFKVAKAISSKEVGILPVHLKITPDELAYRPELALLQRLDEEWAEAGRTRADFDRQHGLNSILLVHYRVGKRSMRHASDEVIKLIAEVAKMDEDKAMGLVGR